MRIDAAPRPRRRMNLTPMIDVVFLLLVFFMMVSRFGTERGMPLTLAGAGGAATWSGPPRLIDIAADSLALNGVTLAPDALLSALVALMATPDDAVVLRVAEGSDVQDLAVVIDLLQGAGIARLAVLP